MQPYFGDLFYDYEDEFEIQKAVRECDLTTSSGIKKYLELKYPSLETDLGTWEFEHEVYENTQNWIPYDYLIEINYDLGLMSHLNNSIKVTDAERTRTRNQLKSFMKTIADDLLKKVTNKKIKGSYKYDYYKYPNIKSGYESLDYCSWSNFEYDGTQDYYEASVSHFRWLPTFDEEKW